MTRTVAIETLAAMTALTLMAGLAIVVGHAIWRRSRDRYQAAVRVLALDFARFLTGGLAEGELLDRAGAGRTDVFWGALEGITDNIDGAEWARLSMALLDRKPVAHEHRRLRSRRAWRRALAARRLGMLDAPRLREPLRRAMQRGPEAVLLPALLALARTHDPATLEWLLAHPDRASHLGRHILVVILKRFGSRAAGAIRRTARRRRLTGLPLELAAIDVLGLWRDGRSRVLVEGLTGHPDMEMRVAAVRALGRLASARSAPRLLRALEDTFWQVRAQAARALGAVGAPEALLPLMGRAGDSSWWVRRRVAYALGAMGQQGKAALGRIQQGADRYAADFASEVLQSLEWAGERPSRARRVG